MTDDLWRRSRKNDAAHDADRAVKKLVSGRIGPSGQRTFHCHFGTVKVAGGTGSVDYLARLGDYADREDLEYLAGDPDEFKEAAEQIDAAATKRNGRTAEKVIVTCVNELPAEFDQAQRQATAEDTVALWHTRGHKAVAAVHYIPDEVQPHMHVAITARPVSKDTGGWVVNREGDRVALRGGKAALRAARREVSDVINNIIGRDFFHPGRLADTGIERKAKRRLPEPVLHRQSARPMRRPQLYMYALAKQNERDAMRQSREEETAREEKERKGKSKQTPSSPEGSTFSRQTDNQQKPTKLNTRRQSDDDPPTTKQMNYLLDLLKKENASLPNSDRVMTRGYVGECIRELHQRQRSHAKGHSLTKGQSR